MGYRHWVASVVLMVAAASPAFDRAPAFAAEAPIQSASAIDGITSSDPALAERSIAALRDSGPVGLQAVLSQYDKSQDARLLPIIDAVAGQHDALYSRLFWYTDLTQARAQAKAQNKPILYLRLLGKLTDEFSCANSRFFRTVLYSNQTVSTILRDQFILVWESERPVPMVTIDYGDGRLLKRTLTGNSIHYVLDPEGRVVDAFPGLFGPQIFAALVQRAGNVAIEKNFDPTHLRYIKQTEDGLLRGWQDQLQEVNPAFLTQQLAAAGVDPKAQAAAAMRLTGSKALVETPLLAQTSPQLAAALDESASAADTATWQKLAARWAENVQLDAASIAMIRRQNPAAYKDQAALDRTVDQFQKLLALDTVRDDYLLRRQVLSWLRVSTTPVALNDLNTRVYSELFLTPRSDPWLGLMPEGAYSALTDDGCCVPPAPGTKVAVR